MADALILSTSVKNCITSQQLREVITSCQSRIYTDSNSNLVMRECIALGRYPRVVEGLPDSDNLTVHIFSHDSIQELESELNEIFTACKELNIPYTVYTNF